MEHTSIPKVEMDNISIPKLKWNNLNTQVEMEHISINKVGVNNILMPKVVINHTSIPKCYKRPHLDKQIWIGSNLDPYNWNGVVSSTN